MFCIDLFIYSDTFDEIASKINLGSEFIRTNIDCERLLTNELNIHYFICGNRKLASVYYIHHR